MSSELPLRTSMGFCVLIFVESQKWQVILQPFVSTWTGYFDGLSLGTNSILKASKWCVFSSGWSPNKSLLKINYLVKINVEDNKWNVLVL